MDDTLSACAPSRLAAAAVLLSAALVRRQPLELPMSSESSRTNIRGCARLMYAALQRAEQDAHHTVFNKFSQSAHQSVAQLYRHATVTLSSVVFQQARGEHRENHSANRVSRKRLRDEHKLDQEESQSQQSASTLSRRCLVMAPCSAAAGERSGERSGKMQAPV